ncbi:ERAD-associated E3 ubiquitin-protein ligase HRD1B-like [Salvia splendens]|uniref:ERAD-associated E3 ubiquitin-protein ligase HRD1B-like n=1 Tax=Salvia splendens TaxID=180675 RepID=UPI001C2681A0|nr:ERAD-associated E3 ubiquitin-protein ligase HRD1B-like [Salvia splendens]XP_042022334.1 ERAD-associated E3 ubiquitin-protein ligase HRD1B-like [Salvia splendens]
MMRLQTYGGISLIATLAVIYHAFSSRGQFYPAMVYLSTSKISLVLLLNMGLVVMCILWQLTKKIFLGKLREAEVERLNEQSWREVMEILFAITIFRQDFSVSFIVMVTALLLIKALHWLAQKRVEYIETTPSVPKLAHIRIVSFMGFLLLLDCSFLYNSIKYILETKQASVSLFFAFEYMILATTTVSTFLKYIFYVSDMLMDGQWEKKAVYTFYLELARDLLHLTMYMCFFLVIFVNYGVPLHLIRELYETFRNFKIRIADYLRYRKITSNMNDRFPDATSEEINSSDATCIICREEMTTAKKLLCGHLFHVHCLRSWLERQNTCPTCRAPVVPPEHGMSTTGTRSGGQQQGTSATGTSSQGSVSSGEANGNISQHQARLQAAASAASMYQTSFVYPSPSTLAWSPGHTVPPQPFGPSGPNMTANDSASASQQDIKVKLIERQIEYLQWQLQHLQESGSEKKTGAGASDIKGKAVSSPSSSSIVDSSETGNP